MRASESAGDRRLLRERDPVRLKLYGHEGLTYGKRYESVEDRRTELRSGVAEKTRETRTVPRGTRSQTEWRFRSAGCCQPEREQRRRLPWDRLGRSLRPPLKWRKPTTIPRWLAGRTVLRSLPAGAGDAGDSGWIPGSGPSPGVETTPAFLPGTFHGQRSLVGFRPWGCRVRQE